MRMKNCCCQKGCTHQVSAEPAAHLYLFLPFLLDLQGKVGGVQRGAAGRCHRNGVALRRRRGRGVAAIAAAAAQSGHCAKRKQKQQGNARPAAELPRDEAHSSAANQRQEQKGEDNQAAAMRDRHVQLCLSRCRCLYRQGHRLRSAVGGDARGREGRRRPRGQAGRGKAHGSRIRAADWRE